MTGTPENKKGDVLLTSKYPIPFRKLCLRDLFTLLRVIVDSL